LTKIFWFQNSKAHVAYMPPWQIQYVNPISKIKSQA